MARIVLFGYGGLLGGYLISKSFPQLGKERGAASHDFEKPF